MVEGVERLIERERPRLRGDPEQEMRALSRQMRDLEGRRERAQDAYLAGAFSVDDLRGRQRQPDEAKASVQAPGATSLRSSPTYRNTS